jgi:hypothetical protein
MTAAASGPRLNTVDRQESISYVAEPPRSVLSGDPPLRNPIVGNLAGC